LRLLEENPLLRDEDLAQRLSVSVSTIRLDRALLGVPELRERMRKAVEQARSRLRSLKHEEVMGELLVLEPNAWAISVMVPTKEMAFRHTNMVADHHIYSQASSLAVAVVEADLVVTGAARVRFRAPVRIGDKLIARAKVGTHKRNSYIVSVRSKVDEREVFVGKFIVVVLDGEKSA